jgi:aryl carrier-like protein
MLQRLPESCFTREDVKSIQDKTGLDVVQIRAWAEKFRYRVPVDERETYLTESGACPSTMPPFTQAQIACLKDTMLKRMPESCFTHEDVKSIQNETGLDVVRIRVWAEKFRYKVPGNERETYLTERGACPSKMPQLSREQTAFLKGIMLQRLPESCFTDEDVKSIQDKAGLDVVQIRAWAEKFRYRVPDARRATYLTDTTTQEESKPLIPDINTKVYLENF